MNNLIYGKAEALCEKIYESFPDGIHEHADGELYIHQTYFDPRTGNTVKHISKIGKTPLFEYLAQIYEQQ